MEIKLLYSGTHYMIKQRIFWLMQIFTPSLQKGCFEGKLKLLNANPHQMTYHFKGRNERRRMVQTRGLYDDPKKTIAVQSFKFLKLINSVNN
jgi:hypothetical protein